MPSWQNINVNDVYRMMADLGYDVFQKQQNDGSKEAVTLQQCPRCGIHFQRVTNSIYCHECTKILQS